MTCAATQYRRTRTRSSARETGCVVHRYCAGVTKTHYDALVKNSTPFVCQFCSLKTTNAVIRQLQTEIESLKTEVAALKELSMSRTDAPSATSTSYAAVTATAANAQLGRRPPRQQCKAAAKPPTSTRSSAAKTTDPSEAAKDAGSQSFEDPRAEEGCCGTWKKSHLGNTTICHFIYSEISNSQRAICKTKIQNPACKTMLVVCYYWC